MFRKVSQVATFSALLFALTSTAQAGTGTASGTATMQVMNQCSVTGANIALGTFTVNNTFMDVANKVGYMYSNATNAVGTNGYEGITWGSVNCDNGTPYQLKITGTTAANGVKIDIGGKTAHLVLLVKSLGGVAVTPTAGAWAPWGAVANSTSVAPPAGTGTGAIQLIKGAAPMYIDAPGMTALPTDKLGTVGNYTDTLSYTLTF